MLYGIATVMAGSKGFEHQSAPASASAAVSEPSEYAVAKESPQLTSNSQLVKIAFILKIPVIDVQPSRVLSVIT